MALELCNTSQTETRRHTKNAYVFIHNQRLDAEDKSWQVQGLLRCFCWFKSVNHVERADNMFRWLKRCWLATLLRYGPASTRKKAVERLSDFNDWRVVKYFLAAQKDSDSSVQGYARCGLSEVTDPRAAKPLIAALKDSDVRVRDVAKERLFQLRDPGVVDPLIVALKDSDSHVRFIAAQALGVLRDSRAVEPMITALGDPDNCVRLEAAAILGEFGNPHAIEPLIAALKDSDSHVRQRAARILGASRDQRALEPLIMALTDCDGEVRKIAADTLGAMGDQRAVEPLITSLSDPDGDVRRMAADALIVLEWIPSTGTERILFAIAKKNVEACALEGTAAVAPLVLALADADRITREVAASALRKVGWKPRTRGERVLYLIAIQNFDACARDGSAAVKPLIRMLEDSDSRVRDQAYCTLRNLGSHSVTPLIAALEHASAEVRETTAKLLGELGDERAIKPLLAMLSESKYSLWRVTVEALSALGGKPSTSRERVVHAIVNQNFGACVQEGPIAVGLLMTALRSELQHEGRFGLVDKGVLKEIVKALRRLLYAGVEIPTQNLREIADLPQRVTWTWRRDDDCGNHTDISEDMEIPEIRQLARQELIRRKASENTT